MPVSLARRKEKKDAPACVESLNETFILHLDFKGSLWHRQGVMQMDDLVRQYVEFNRLLTSTRVREA